MTSSTGPRPDAARAPQGLVVLIPAGGTSHRFDGRDKTAVALDGRPVLRHLLDGVRTALGPVPIVVAADHDHPAHNPAEPGVRWVRENPPGGGPVAGIGSAWAAAQAEAGETTAPDDAIVVLLAGDLPFAASAVPRLLHAVQEVPRPPTAAPGAIWDAALARTPDGRDHYLLSVVRGAVLTRQLGAAATWAGRSMRSVFTGLRVTSVEVSAMEALDLDTVAAFDAAQRLLARPHLAADPGHSRE